MTREIKELALWLTEAGCEMAAMESTGPYWKPLYNRFELLGLDAMIVNAAHDTIELEFFKKSVKQN